MQWYPEFPLIQDHALLKYRYAISSVYHNRAHHGLFSLIPECRSLLQRQSRFPVLKRPLNPNIQYPFFHPHSFCSFIVAVYVNQYIRYLVFLFEFFYLIFLLTFLVDINRLYWSLKYFISCCRPNDFTGLYARTYILTLMSSYLRTHVYELVHISSYNNQYSIILYGLQFILPAAKSNLLRMCKAGFPLGIRMCHLEMIMVFLLVVVIMTVFTIVI